MSATHPLKNYSTMEYEAAGLCVCVEAMNDMANHSMVSLLDVSDGSGEVQVNFHSSVHRDLFLIRLLDFVKEGGSSDVTGLTGSCLDVLKNACVTKSFDESNSVSQLKFAVDALSNWLNQSRKVKMWLPSLNIDAIFEVPRADFLFIAANSTKHNLSRLTRVAYVVEKSMISHGYTVSKEQVVFALNEFNEHLSDNYFVYYGTWLMELINNVRWGLHAYLFPVFSKSYRNTEDGLYGFEYPDSIHHEMPRLWFWRLMNTVRRQPYLRKFSGARSFKQESSLEW